MKQEDLSFTIKNEQGMEVICDIVSVVPNNENEEEPYVVFTDYMLDENNEFVLQYGKLIKVDGIDVLRTVNDNDVVLYIKSQLTDEIVNYVNTQIQDNLYE